MYEVKMQTICFKSKISYFFCTYVFEIGRGGVKKGVNNNFLFSGIFLIESTKSDHTLCIDLH